MKAVRKTKARGRSQEEQRKADLARIHIAKKELRLADSHYRAIIASVLKQQNKSAAPSAANLNGPGRAEVLHIFKGMGWKDARAQRPPRPQRRQPAAHDYKGRYYGGGQKGEAANLTQGQADEISRLEIELRWEANPKRLTGFIERTIGEKRIVSALSNRQASSVITALRRMAAEAQGA